MSQDRSTSEVKSRFSELSHLWFAATMPLEATYGKAQQTILVGYFLSETCQWHKTDGDSHKRVQAAKSGKRPD